MSEKKGRWRCFICGASKRGNYREWDLHYRSMHYLTPAEWVKSCR